MVSAFVLYYGAQLSCPNISQLLRRQKEKDAAKKKTRYLTVTAERKPQFGLHIGKEFFEVYISRGPYADHYILLAIILKLGYERAMTLNGLSVTIGPIES
jgi:hypothetical protein